jgi:hypothetical protein
MNARDRRALAGGTLAVALAAGYAGLVRPVVHHLDEVRARGEAQRGLLARELALLEDARGYRERMDRLEAEVPEGARWLFTGRDEVGATAALAAHLTEAARIARMHVDQVEHRPGEIGADGLVELRVEFRAAGDLEGLLTFLHRVQGGPEIVRLETLSVEARDRRGADEDQEELWLTASARGYALAPTGPETPAAGTP